MTCIPHDSLCMNKRSRSVFFCRIEELSELALHPEVPTVRRPDDYISAAELRHLGRHAAPLQQQQQLHQQQLHSTAAPYSSGSTSSSSTSSSSSNDTGGSSAVQEQTAATADNSNSEQVASKKRFWQRR
eukprot:5705-Heterococcus_DN1.PRE.1